MTEKVLVTGADGFIGSHLTEQLVRAGHDVRAFVYYNSFNSWGWLDSVEETVLSQVEVVSGDIRDAGGVDSAVAGCSHVSLRDSRVLFNCLTNVSITVNCER